MTTSDDLAGLFRRGWALFPLQPGSKRPLPGSSGLHEASDDPLTADRWVQQPERGVAVATGEASGLVVVDIDELGAISHLKARGPLPPTLTARTPRGGLHLYYAHPGGQVRNSAGERGWLRQKGVDVRGDGGYVVCPPTVTVASDDGTAAGRYCWTSTAPVAPLPDWIAEAARRPERPAPDASPLPPADAGGTTRWGATVLERELATLTAAPEGERNASLYHAALKVAGAVKAGQLDEQPARSGLLQVAERIGLTPSESEATVGSAWAVANERAPAEPSRLVSAVQHTGVPQDHPEPEVEGEGTEGWMTVSDIMSLPPVRWLIPMQVPVGVTLLFAQRGSGKSFTALDWSLSLACGELGEPQTVAYATGEGLDGWGQRVQAWLTRHGHTTEALHGRFVARSGRKFPKLMDPGSIADLCRDIERLPAPPKLLVIDTLGRSLGGGEESSHEFGRTIAVCDDLRDRYDMSTVLVHHAGVNPDRERGSTVLGDGADAIWRLDKPDIDKGGRYHQLTNTKMKGGQEHPPIERMLNTYGDSALLLPTCAEQARPLRS